MSRWTFYTAPGTCALATHIALHEAGAEFDLVKLNIAAGQQQSPDYLRVNPKGRVPALATPQGVLTETPALLAFVAQSFPAAGLAPLDDPFAFARMQELASYLASTAHVAHAHKRRGARWADDPAAHEAMRAKVPQTMTVCAAYLEAQIVGPWVAGNGTASWMAICIPSAAGWRGWRGYDAVSEADGVSGTRGSAGGGAAGGEGGAGLMRTRIDRATPA